MRQKASATGSGTTNAGTLCLALLMAADEGEARVDRLAQHPARHVQSEGNILGLVFLSLFDALSPRSDTGWSLR